MAVTVKPHNFNMVQGQRYRVVLEGRCDYYLGDRTVSLGEIEMAADSPEIVSVVHLPDPLKVGIEIRGESPIPVPIGTVLRSATGVIMEKTPHGWMSPGSDLALGGEPNPNGPPDIFPLTVLYVPDQS